MWFSVVAASVTKLVIFYEIAVGRFDPFPQENSQASFLFSRYLVLLSLQRAHQIQHDQTNKGTNIWFHE